MSILSLGSPHTIAPRTVLPWESIGLLASTVASHAASALIARASMRLAATRRQGGEGLARGAWALVTLGRLRGVMGGLLLPLGRRAANESQHSKRKVNARRAAGREAKTTRWMGGRALRKGAG